MPGAGQEAAVAVVEIKAARSIAVRADPDRVWQLLVSPAIWSLKARAFMFAVPGADRLCLWVGSTVSGLPGNGLYEVAVDDSARSVMFQEPAPSRHFYRLAVCPGRRGKVKVHIEVARYSSRLRADAVETATRAGLVRWLSRIQAVAENRSPAPSDVISAEVQRLCLQVPRQPKDWVSVTETAVIRADPSAVWAAVSAPHFDPASPGTPVACGYVPGTPVGQPGEMQYFVERLDDGALTSQAVAVSAMTDHLEAIAHRVRPPYDQTRYRVSADGGQAKLEMTWTGPPGPAGASREPVAAGLRAVLSHHKAALQDTAEPDS
jgi:hypothetical protein